MTFLLSTIYPLFSQVCQVVPLGWGLPIMPAYNDQISDKITPLSRASIWNLDGDKPLNRVAEKSIQLKIMLVRK
jgi:hypothetical protein